MRRFFYAFENDPGERKKEMLRLREKEREGEREREYCGKGA